MKLIEFKYPHLEAEFERLDFRLQIQTYALAGFVFHKFGIVLVVTSCIRMDDMTSVHYWLCGLDFRERSFTAEQIKEIKKFCSHFEYDEKRPRKKALFIHANRSKNGKHGHFQVFPSSDTTRIKK